MAITDLTTSTDYRRIERAINYLVEHFREQPRLAEVARHAGLSEFHFQRLFRRWAGISPKRFVQVLTARQAANILRAPGNLFASALDTGLSGSGRLHDLFVNVHAMTPGEWKARGGSVCIDYGFHATPFGECLIGLTARGVCHFAFVESAGRRRALANLTAAWPKATLRSAPTRTRTIIDRIFGARRNGKGIDLALKGTNFQIKVWEALLKIPPGAVTTYEAIAEKIGAPRAARAVANAVANNPVGFLIPCHRVIRKSGVLGGYHWGAPRKQTILAWEAARHATATTRSAAPGSD